MSDQDKASKTEEPTSKRLKEAFAEGQFAKAPEVAAAFTLAAAFVVFVFIVPSHAALLAELGRRTFGRLGQVDFSHSSAVYWFQLFVKEGLVFLLPLFAVVVTGVVAAGALQTGFRISPKALGMKFERLNPVNGAKNLVSSHKFIQFAVDLMKFGVVGVVLYIVIKRILKDPIFHFVVPPHHLVTFIYETFLVMLVNLLVALSIIATLHLLYQKKKKHDDLRMTKQEVKDEHRSQEGDPAIKNKRRSMAIRMMQKQMLAAVPNADVVVTNPTHYAVALKYEQGKDVAPVILAKGHQRFALRIKRLAQEHGVPTVENRMAARLLYKLGRVGEPIPSELYQVIAEILRYVYKTHRLYFHELRRRRLRGEGTHG